MEIQSTKLGHRVIRKVKGIHNTNGFVVEAEYTGNDSLKESEWFIARRKIFNVFVAREDFKKVDKKIDFLYKTTDGQVHRCLSKALKHIVANSLEDVSICEMFRHGHVQIRGACSWELKNFRDGGCNRHQHMSYHGDCACTSEKRRDYVEDSFNAIKKFLQEHKIEYIDKNNYQYKIGKLYVAPTTRRLRFEKDSRWYRFSTNEKLYKFIAEKHK